MATKTIINTKGQVKEVEIVEQETCTHPREFWMDDADRDYIGDWGDQPVYIDIDIFVCGQCGKKNPDQLVERQPSEIKDGEEIPF